jgi:hypothetical protein
MKKVGVRLLWAERLLRVADLVTNPDLVWRGAGLEDGLPRSWIWFSIAERADSRARFNALVQAALNEIGTRVQPPGPGEIGIAEFTYEPTARAGRTVSIRIIMRRGVVTDETTVYGPSLALFFQIVRAESEQRGGGEFVPWKDLERAWLVAQNWKGKDLKPRTFVDYSGVLRRQFVRAGLGKYWRHEAGLGCRWR